MIELNGENIESLPFKELRKISDLIYYDGPILSHFQDADNNDILWYWVDSNETYNRWLLFQITKTDLAKYLSKEKTLFDLLDSAVHDVFYTVDIPDASSIEYKNITRIHKRNLPAEYKPEPNSLNCFGVPDVYDMQNENQ